MFCLSLFCRRPAQQKTVLKKPGSGGRRHRRQYVVSARQAISGDDRRMSGALSYVVTGGQC